MSQNYIKVGDKLDFKSLSRGTIHKFEVTYISEYIVSLQCLIVRNNGSYETSKYMAYESLIIRNGRIVSDTPNCYKICDSSVIFEHTPSRVMIIGSTPKRMCPSPRPGGMKL